MKELLTNEIKFKLKLEEFKKIYKIDCFRKKDGHIYRKDILKEQKYSKIQSVFISGDKVFILAMIEDKIEYQELIIAGYVRIEENLNEKIIFSLLLNSLSKSKTADNNMSNILGSLYYFVRRKDSNLVFLNINFYGNRLNLNVSTFTSILSKNDGVRFVLKGNKLCYPDEGEKGNYAKRNYDERSNVAFVNVKIDDYKKCKSVIANEILAELNNRYKDFLFVEFVFRSFESVKWQKNKNISLSIDYRVNQFRINIINSTESFDVANKLRQLLLNNCRINIFEPSIEISDSLKPDCLNINIVLPKEKYPNGDKYIISDFIPVQNIYFDTLKKEYSKVTKNENFMSSVVEKIIMELLFKLDLIERKVNLLKVYNIEVPKWKFFITGYTAADKQKYKGSVYVENESLIIDYSKDDRENPKLSYRIETDNKKMFCNLESNYYPLPNARFLNDLMKENEKSANIDFSLEEIKDIVNTVIKKNDILLELLNGQSKTHMSSFELRDLFKLQKNRRAFSLIDKEYYNRHNIHIYNSPLTSENKENIFNPCSDINYYVTKDKRGNDVVYYFVGKMEEVSKQDFSSGSAKWMPIKDINNCSKEDFQQYLNLIKNDILSVNKYSTKPVLFKYLIEFIETNIKLKNRQE